MKLMATTHLDPLEKEFDVFRINLIEFIKINVSFKFEVPSLNFKIKYFFSRNTGGSVLIYCIDSNHLFEIINLLETNKFYIKRLGTEDRTVKVNQLEKFDLPEKVNLLKKFFLKLKGLLNENFFIEPPATLLAGELKDEGFIKISLTFLKTNDVDQFVSKIPNEWNYDVTDLKKIVINIDLIEIQEFISEKCFQVKTKNSAIKPILNYQRNIFIEDNSSDFIPDKKKLGYTNPSISYFGHLFNNLEPVYWPKNVDVDIGPKSVKKSTEIKELNKTKQIKSSIMKNAAMTLIAQKRREFAKHFIAGLQTTFTNFDSRIKIETGRFTHTAEGFDFSVPVEFSEIVKNHLKINKNQYEYKGSGKFTIIYSEKYSPQSQNKDESKKMIKLCEIERNGILRILASSKYFHKKGGRAKKQPGVFGISKTSNIAEHLTMILFISNKQLDTLNQIFKIVANYYLDHEKKDLVNARKDEKEFKIIVSYQQDFFKTEKDDDQDDKDSGNTQVGEETLHQQKVGRAENVDDEIFILAELAHEEEQGIDAQIERLQKMKELKNKEFLISKFDSFADIIWDCLAEKNVKVFLEGTSEEEGLQTLSLISVKKLKNLVSLRVLEKLKGN